MRLDVIDFGRHELAPLPLLTHRAKRLLRQHPPAQPLPPVGAIPLPTTRELANAPAHSRTYSSQFTSFADLVRGSRSAVRLQDVIELRLLVGFPAAIGSFPWLGQERDDLS